ncbi:hypothetical protein HID58_059716, partial [Brassica napus]
MEGGRVRVCVNGDEPLKFECKVSFQNGAVVKRISHEEGTCPELTEGQREIKRMETIDQKEAEERTNREAFSIPQRVKIDLQRRFSPEPLKGRKSRERYHPYQQPSRVGSRDKMRDTASSSEWKKKETPRNKERYEDLPRKEFSRNRASPDSQRTVSENMRRPSYRGDYWSRKSRSPPQTRTEWRPVSNARDGRNRKSISHLQNHEERDLTGSRRSVEQVPRRGGDLEAVKNQKDIGANVERAITNKLSINGNASMEKNLKDNQKGHNSTSQNRERVSIEDETEDQTWDNPLDDLAEGEMDAAMLENDNLLDEDNELITEKTYETIEEEQTEALSQLLPDVLVEKQTRPKAPRPAKDVPEQRNATEAGKGNKAPRDSHGTPFPTNQGNKRGARSPDKKGLAASKKLAN